MDIYSLSRNFWDYAFENPDKIKPNHVAIYFFAIEHCNRLGWKDKFGLPTTMVMEAVSIKSYNTYIHTFNDLVEIGLFKLHQKSKNQYSSNVIGISNFNKAFNKALDKALIKHTTKHMTKQHEGTSSIDIPIYNSTNIQINKDTEPLAFSFRDELFERWFSYKKEKKKKYTESGKLALIKKWENVSDSELENAINNSMASNWDGLFPEKKSNFGQNQNDQSKGKIQKNFENIEAAANQIQKQIEDGTFVNPFDRFR